MSTMKWRECREFGTNDNRTVMWNIGWTSGYLSSKTAIIEIETSKNREPIMRIKLDDKVLLSTYFSDETSHLDIEYLTNAIEAYKRHKKEWDTKKE